MTIFKPCERISRSIRVECGGILNHFPLYPFDLQRGRQFENIGQLKFSFLRSYVIPVVSEVQMILT